MKRYLPLLLLLCSPVVLMAQGDTVASKIRHIPTKHVDALAQFPQGDFKNYIAGKLQHPHHIDKDIAGQIILLTEISDDGSISHVTVLKNLSPLIDPEIVKAVYSSPKWQPAMLNGQKTSMKMVFNIDILVKGDKKNTISSYAAKPASPSRTLLTSSNTAVPSHKAYLFSAPGLALPKNKPTVVTSKKMTAPVIAKKAPAVPDKKSAPVAVKKPIAPLAKKVEPPVKKVTVPPMVAKKITPPVKKITPPPVKKPEPVAIKKEIAVKKVIPPPIPKKTEVAVVKKTPPPVKTTPPPVKKPQAPVAKIVTPPVKKVAAPQPALVAKKIVQPVKKEAVPAKKTITTIAKNSGQQQLKTAADANAQNGAKVVTQVTPPVKKPKRKVIKGNLFKPSEESPIFPNGGLTALYHFLSENISYPSASKLAGVEGTVLLKFVVDEEGVVTDVEVISSPAEDLSQEAIRVFLASPRWKPASQNGTKVAVSFEIPIKFSLGPKAPPPNN